MRQGQARSRSMNMKPALMVVIALGSAWGFLEVVLGGGMKAANIPYKGDLLTGLGIGLMGVALAFWRKPAALVGMAAVAVAVKQLAVPILGLPFMCKANSCLAVMLAGGGLAVSAAVVGKRLDRGRIPRIGAGLAAGIIAATGFYFVGMRLAPCPYLLSFNRPGGFLAFTGAESLIWMALGGGFFPVGYHVGLRLRDGVYGTVLARPSFYYGVSAAIVAVAWAASAVAIAAGL